MANIIILGAGVMGSAFSFPCIDNGHNVSLIGSPLENNIIDKLNRKNKFHKALGLSLSKKLKIFKVDKLTEKLKLKNDLIVVAVNSKGIEWAAKQIAKSHNGKTPILILTKGLSVIDNSITTMSDNFKENMNNIFKFKNLSITSVAGPCLAKDLAKKAKTFVVFANLKIKVARKIKKLIETSYYNIECSKYQYAVEHCAAIKNFYSMIIGSAKDLNTSSILFHKSVIEMAKFVQAWEGYKETAYGLAGMALPILWHDKEGEHIIKAGTPLAQMFLVPKEVKQMKHTNTNTNEDNEARKQMNLTGLNMRVKFKQDYPMARKFWQKYWKKIGWYKKDTKVSTKENLLDD